MIKHVRIVTVLKVDDDRDIDLEDPCNWNITLLDPETNEIIFDVNLNRKGETCWMPEVIVW